MKQCEVFRSTPVWASWWIQVSLLIIPETKNGQSSFIERNQDYPYFIFYYFGNSSRALSIGDETSTFRNRLFCNHLKKKLAMKIFKNNRCLIVWILRGFVVMYTYRCGWGEDWVMKVSSKYLLLQHWSFDLFLWDPQKLVKWFWKVTKIFPRKVLLFLKRRERFVCSTKI